ncbi:uncharacterized protein N7496_004973 [Penicillium cataractarum]|uniref:X-Pro dipeptidyl-peptidase n=1 Tax=Penicillium cataractarum TaxID=2100454 RepID=A0A9W9SH55_9EURO|nr:uncharacterized protein N7496_004973 [Penicillium cataractarum]KAJ5377564.1 hypothetical protein N7496_004973 [Penicillium cataractarum]
MVLFTSPRGVAIRLAQTEPIRDRIERVTADLKELKEFLPIELSPRRHQRLQDFLTSELTELNSFHDLPFALYDQEAKVDYLLLKNFLEREVRTLDLEAKQDEKLSPLVPFANTLVDLCEARTLVMPMDPKVTAQTLFDCQTTIVSVIEKVKAKSGDMVIPKNSAFRAANHIIALKGHLKEWFSFYTGYDPTFDWWVAHPYGVIDQSLQDLAATIKEVLVEIKPGDDDAIVGQPIGREGLLFELRAEMFPYTPEEIISIGEKEFDWCITEMKKASRSMGYSDDWKKALEEVKNDFVEPGQQTQLVRDLVHEAVLFVEDHDLVTVPEIAKNSWQMFMMSPERQKVNPFFLGGDCIIVSYPTDAMDHEAKMMSLRGNNIHFSRATVFHEMIPGHHLQMYMNARHRPYRRVFDTPFWIEGWSLYWEFFLWNDERWIKTPQNRIGMLWWRLHRCARIIFSVNFHLGRMSPQECIDLLVEDVGHERATAEGEVRRSLNGDYSPLYQAGYMLGALQIFALRKEMVDARRMSEKEFHDRFLKGNRMPIEMVRALMQDQPLSPEFQPSWRFYPL